MKTVIEMAREAGFAEKDAMYRVAFVANKNNLERFAELVRADERDCVMNEPITKAHWQRFENDIRADEREACAKVCESHGPTLANGAMLADAIRARGNT